FGVKVQGLGLKVQGLGLKVQGSGLKVQGSGFKVQGSKFRVQGSGFKVQGSTMRRRVFRAVVIAASSEHEGEHSFWIAPANSSRSTWLAARGQGGAGARDQGCGSGVHEIMCEAALLGGAGFRSHRVGGWMQERGLEGHRFRVGPTCHHSSTATPSGKRASPPAERSLLLGCDGSKLCFGRQALLAGAAEPPSSAPHFLRNLQPPSIWSPRAN
ncbi:hypothetical protein T484DRAFT_3642103, partial [Baffinella frigidus]